MFIKDDILAPNGGGGGTPSEKKYKNWYIPVISNNSNIKKFRNSQSINYQDLSINLKEVNNDITRANKFSISIIIWK